MANHTYKFIGETPEEFHYLPADPPSRVLQPGDIVVCTQKVEHARLELQEKAESDHTTKPSAAKAAPTTTPEA